MCFKKPFIGKKNNINYMVENTSVFFYHEDRIISLEIVFKEYDADGDVQQSYIERGIQDSDVTYYYEIKSIDDDKTTFYIATAEKSTFHTTIEMVNYE
jgi:hypothetical protein